jgi:hypothetical protein
MGVDSDGNLYVTAATGVYRLTATDGVTTDLGSGSHEPAGTPP